MIFIYWTIAFKILFTQHSPAMQQIFFKPVVRFEDHIQDDLEKAFYLHMSRFPANWFLCPKIIKNGFVEEFFFLKQIRFGSSLKYSQVIFLCLRCLNLFHPDISYCTFLFYRGLLIPDREPQEARRSPTAGSPTAGSPTAGSSTTWQGQEAGVPKFRKPSAGCHEKLRGSPQVQ